MKKRSLPNRPLQIIYVGGDAKAKHAIVSSRQGEHGLLCEMLRAQSCPRLVRAHAADLIEGKATKLPTINKELLHVRTAIRVTELESAGWKREAAVKQTASELEISERTVRSSLAFCKLVKPGANCK